LWGRTEHHNGGETNALAPKSVPGAQRRFIPE
jgi:hypothetical protein